MQNFNSKNLFDTPAFTGRRCFAAYLAAAQNIDSADKPKCGTATAQPPEKPLIEKRDSTELEKEDLSALFGMFSEPI